jgi:hypothetical protein
MRTRFLQAIMVLFLVPFSIVALLGIGLILTMVVAAGTLSLVHHIFPYNTLRK